MKWYVMRAISGKENKVREYAEAMLQQKTNFAKHVKCSSASNWLCSNLKCSGF